MGVGYFVNAKTGKLSRFEEAGLTYDLYSVSDCGIAAGSYTPTTVPRFRVMSPKVMVS